MNTVLVLNILKKLIGSEMNEASHGMREFEHSDFSYDQNSLSNSFNFSGTDRM